MFRELPKRGWKLGHCVIESPPVILSWRKGTATIMVLDTLNWWRHSLAQIGESVGTPKLVMPKLKASGTVWDRYCRNDVDVIRVAMRRWWAFLHEFDLGGFAPTLASQAFRAWRHRFMSHPVLIDANPSALKLARSSYHGGRTEAFRLGKVQGRVHVLDVNSMYPFVMRDERYPTTLKLHARRPSLSELRRWLTRFCVVARCQIRTSVPRYAIVLDGRLVFPVGRFEATLTTP
ncbi:MAG TPA: DNA polymerase, partial [Candidatus Paceibacterota bacterium]|nr:DNA polymerase [Candidatus Paceibacterota bacterium]